VDHVHYTVSDLKPQAWVRNFHMMSMCIGVNHGVEGIYFAYITLIYPSNLSWNCNMLVHAVYALSAAFIASPVTIKLGSKLGIVLGLALFCIQYLAFWICSMSLDAWYMPTVAYFGAISSGIGAGLLWTAQGTFFAQTAQRVADATGQSLEAKSAALASVYGLWAMGIEFVIKMLSFGLVQAGVHSTIDFALGLLLAITSTVAAASCTQPVHGCCTRQRSRCNAMLGTMSLWLDARIWLLSFTSIIWAIIVALLHGVVTKQYVEPQLGKQSVALLSAIISLVGALVQYPLRVMAWSCGKGIIMLVASLLMILIPVLTKVLDLDHLGWWLVSFFILCGVIHGIETATNKAVYADHFPGPKAEAAFANLAMQSAVGACLALLFQRRLTGDQISMIVVGLSALVLPGYSAARGLQEAEKNGFYDGDGACSGIEASSSDEDSEDSNSL